MIITRTPFRISFFGGGTDYPVWLREHPGAVISTTIDKFCFISARHLPPFHEHKHRIVWSRNEMVNSIDQIRHPSVRACLRYMKIDKGVEIHHDGDLPARTGMGSSSSFSVGMLHALHALRGRMVSKRRLALDTIRVEQDLIKEDVGCQDQIAAAFGGFNLTEISSPKDFVVKPITVKPSRLATLQRRLMLFFTGVSRTAAKIAKVQIQQTHKKEAELKAVYEMVYQALDILQGGGSLDDFGRLLHESWMLKRGMTRLTTTPLVDEIYAKARKAGALGGKLLGAGGGGFILFYARSDKQEAVRRKLKHLVHVPFRFERQGSIVIVYRPQEELSAATR